MRALIAMSGGVDSSVAACLMKEAGYDCIGITMKLFQNEDLGLSKGHTCCSLDDVEDARSVAYKMHMPYYVFNFTEQFRKYVIEPFLSCYLQGITPNPCINCNRYLKFETLYHRAKELQCNYIVTGHYVRIAYDQETGRYLLKKAVDLSKDQSYVLYNMTQEQLKHTRFPLGNLEKTQVREIAKAHHFNNAQKHDSQDICFAPDGDYATFIERQTGCHCRPGNFTDQTGRILGTHRGIIHYTIGQHRKLGLNLPESRYVCDIRPESNTVVLGEQDALFSREVFVGDFNWISGDAPMSPFRCKAKIRYRQQEQWAVVTPVGADAVNILFDEPQRAVTPGQAAVLYDGDIVLGGGTILKQSKQQ
jgi:tRNA-specific 2-thiouridylase